MAAMETSSTCQEGAVPVAGMDLWKRWIRPPCQIQIGSPVGQRPNGSRARALENSMRNRYALSLTLLVLSLILPFPAHGSELRGLMKALDPARTRE